MLEHQNAKMESWQWKAVRLCVLAFLATVGIYFALQLSSFVPPSTSPRFTEEAQTTINGQVLKLEIVETEAEIQQGLSDRLSMQDDEGMLFEMGFTDIHPFWMQRMHFALDMIWIRDGVIVDIARNMPPPSETGGIPKTYTPKVAADQVLELTAGGVDRYELKIGDRLVF